MKLKHCLLLPLALFGMPVWADSTYVQKLGQLADRGISASFELVMEVADEAATMQVKRCVLKTTVLRGDTSFNAGKFSYALVKSQNNAKTVIGSGEFTVIDLKEGEPRVREDAVAGHCEEIDGIDATMQLQIVRKLNA